MKLWAPPSEPKLSLAKAGLGKAIPFREQPRRRRPEGDGGCRAKPVAGVSLSGELPELHPAFEEHSAQQGRAADGTGGVDVLAHELNPVRRGEVQADVAPLADRDLAPIAKRVHRLENPAVGSRLPAELRRQEDGHGCDRPHDGDDHHQLDEREPAVVVCSGHYKISNDT